MTYRDIRDQQGRLIARFDPKRDLLAIKARGCLNVVDLRQLRDAKAEEAEEPQRPAPQRPS